MPNTDPPPDPSDLVKTAFHEAGHAAYLGVTGIARVWEITLDSDTKDQYPEGEVRKHWLVEPSDDQFAMSLLVGPLAELKCIANYEENQEWRFDPESEITGIAEQNDHKVSAKFVTHDGGTKVVTESSDPFETDFGPVRDKAGGTAAVINQRIRMTQDWLDVSCNWTVVKQIASSLTFLKGKPVLRRQIFGPQIPPLLKIEQS